MRLRARHGYHVLEFTAAIARFLARGMISSYEQTRHRTSSVALPDLDLVGGRHAILSGGGRMAKDERAASFSNVPLFHALSQRQVRRILRGTFDYEYSAGSELVRQGDDGETLFVILDGNARVVRNGRTVARLRNGDFFGEISVLNDRPRTASVVAETDVRCLALHRDDLRKILVDEPRIAWNLLGALAGRVRGN